MVEVDSTDAWRTIFEYSFEPAEQSRMQPVGSSSPRLCRFCGNGRPVVSFKSEAHIIATAFGNREFVHYEECDGCNNLGSRLEDALAKMLTVPRAVSRIRTRSGPAKHKFGKAPSYIESDVETNTVIVSQEVGDDTITSRWTQNGRAWDIRVPRFDPTNACRAVARMGLFVASPAQLLELDHVRRWIRGEAQWLPTFFRAFVPGAGLREVTLRVHRHRDLAAYRVTFMYSTAIVVLHLPRPDWSFPPDLTVPLLPLSPYPPHVTNWDRFRVSRSGDEPAHSETINVVIPAFARLPPVEQQAIANEAYYRFLARVQNRTPGSDVTDWIEAEQHLFEQRARNAGLWYLIQVGDKWLQ